MDSSKMITMNKTNKKLLILGAVLGFLAVILGAFGAHGLEGKIDAKSIASFETGVRYQFYHAFLLLMIGGFLPVSEKLKNWLFYMLLIGVIFFSGSIYLLSTQNISGINFSSIALITPFGGLFLIVSWFLLLYSFFKR